MSLPVPGRQVAALARPHGLATRKALQSWGHVLVFTGHVWAGTTEKSQVQHSESPPCAAVGVDEALAYNRQGMGAAVVTRAAAAMEAASRSTKTHAASVCAASGWHRFLASILSGDVCVVGGQRECGEWGKLPPHSWRNGTGFAVHMGNCRHTR